MRVGVLDPDAKTFVQETPKRPAAGRSLAASYRGCLGCGSPRHKHQCAPGLKFLLPPICVSSRRVAAYARAELAGGNSTTVIDREHEQ